tara:strand:- start:87 stop:707 length:621 start_codon:yes stop_codon:yes gene_type:complete
MRPFIDSICGPSVVDAAAIGAHARAYIGEKHAAGSPFTVQADVKAWAQRYLHQLMLGIDLSEEDAQEFGQVQARAAAVVRYFPPVVGFPWWEMRGEHAGRRTLLSLAMANRDPRVWGSDAEEFKLRPLSQYHKLAGVAWADLAVDGNMSRSCPAKDLSIVLASEFLEAWFDAQPSKWELPAEDAAAIKFTASTPFVSTFAFQPTKE